MIEQVVKLRPREEKTVLKVSKWCSKCKNVTKQKCVYTYEVVDNMPPCYEMNLENKEL